MTSNPRIVFHMHSGLITAWVVSIVVTAFLGAIAFFSLRDLSWQVRPPLFAGAFGGGLALLGAFVVAGMWTWVVRVTLLSRHYGDAELELLSTPIRLGGKLKGRIRAEASMATGEAINLVLQCWGNRSGGGDSGGDSWLRWDSETLITADEVEQANGELLVPVDLEIPAEQLPTGKAEDRWDITWILKMNLEPDIGYRPSFDIPVERRDEAAPAAAETLKPPGQSSLNVRHKIVGDPNCKPPPRPPNARVRVEPQPEGGIKITPPAARSSTFLNAWCLVTLPLWVVLPLWGLAELDSVESPPIIAYLIQLGVAFGAAFLFNGLPLLGQAFVTHSFQLGPAGVAAKRLLRKKRFPPGRFTCSVAVGSSWSKWMVSLERSEIDFFGGLHVAIVSTEAEARWLVAELAGYIGPIAAVFAGGERGAAE